MDRCYDPQEFYETPMTWEQAATLVGVIALLLAVWEGVQNRRHNRLSVRPRLGFGLSLDPGKPHLALSNGGLGPAIITRLWMACDGQPVKAVGYGDFLDLLQTAGLAENDMTHSFPGDSVLEHGESISLLAVEPRVGAVDAFVRGLWRLSLVIEYESMYGERQRLTSATLRKNLEEAVEVPDATSGSRPL